MAVVKPFKGIRPVKDKVHLVAARSVASYSPAQLHSKLSENPFTFFHVIKPEFGELLKSKPNSPELLHKIKAKFLSFVKEGVLITDKEDCFYIYQQIKSNHAFTGIIACASVEDYYNNVIKKHEQTIVEREEILKDYLEICDFNAEPVCLCYPDNKSVDTIISEIICTDTTYDFTTTDRIRHRVWVIKDKSTIAKIANAFSNIPSIYIADGHHRCASSARLGKFHKEKNINHTGNEPYNFFMAAFFPASNLKVYEFNRIARDLNGLSLESFVKKLSDNFILEECTETICKPKEKNIFGMYLERRWFTLKLKKQNPKPDTDLLTELILSPILNIHDLRRDRRISFLSGVQGLNTIKKIVDGKRGSVGFILNPTTIYDILKVADANGSMPPKSTWVEPKLRSGLVIYSLS